MSQRSLNSILIAATVIVLLIAGVLLTRVDRTFVDLNTGDRLDVRSIAGFDVWQTISVTRFSQVARADAVSSSPRRAWRQVTERTILNPTSPHFRHHGTLNALQSVTTACDQHAIKGELQQIILRDVLAALQSDDSDRLQRTVDVAIMRVDVQSP